MPSRTGTADLPLHGGKAPRWLFERRSRLAPAIVEGLVIERGPAFVLERARVGGSERLHALKRLATASGSAGRPGR